MNWLTKFITAHDCRYQTRLLGLVFGVVVLCCSSFVFADEFNNTVEFDDLAWIDDYTEAVNDVDLSFINGKGTTEAPLGDSGKLAIILWDERGNDNKRGTNHDVSSQPLVNLTVIHK